MDALKITLTEDSYSRQTEPTFADCDCRQKLRMSALLRLAADYAGHDYDARGLTHKKLLEMGETFLLSRVALRVHRHPCAWELLDVTTWEDGAKGPNFHRYFEITGQAGQLCVSMKSDWILVDPANRRILRPSAFTALPLRRCPKEIDCPDPKKIFLPREGGAELGVRQVVWSDLDGNGHLYSARYGDIVWDYLPSDLQARTPREFYINYSREATLGQSLRLTGFREEAAFRMEGLGPDGPCFTALCVF